MDTAVSPLQPSPRIIMHRRYVQREYIIYYRAVHTYVHHNTPPRVSSTSRKGGGRENYIIDQSVVDINEMRDAPAQRSCLFSPCPTPTFIQAADLCVRALAAAAAAAHRHVFTNTARVYCSYPHILAIDRQREREREKCTHLACVYIRMQVRLSS